MTSLASLAHTVPAAPPFNADFYITAATVIPVWFLAFAIQGRAYEDALSAAVRLARRAQAEHGPQRDTLAFAARLLQVGTWFVVGVAGYGELLAVDALYHETDTSSTGQWVLFSVAFLTIVTLIGPALKMMRYGAEMSRAERGLPPSATSPAASASAETGETGTA